MAKAKAKTRSADATSGANAAGVASYLTPAVDEVSTAEFVDRKSRFIAHLTHVESEDEASAFIESIRHQHYDARHNVPAWILADGTERQSDDGEPQRTSGMPTLEVLRGAGLRDCCCVVTRYFGGTLLGPGGLVRAYTTATQRAVEAAREAGLLVEKTLVTVVELTIPYAMHDRVRDLAERSGAHDRGSEYGADVTLTLAFRAGEEVAFVDAMREMAAGQDLCRVSEPSFSVF